MPRGKPNDGSKNPGGRPKAYDSAEDMQQLIDNYFKDCEGTPLIDDEGKPYLDKNYQPIITGKTPPSIAGLAYALGFTSRQSLLNYQDDEKFMDVITRAKLRIEIYNNSRLYDKDGVQGAKFNLTVNYGYIDKTETDLNIKEMPMIILKRLDKE